MPRTDDSKRALTRWIVLACAIAPAAAIAGIQAQGIQAQGIQAQGIQAQGIQAQGIQAQGIQAQGIQAQGIQAQGIQAQGIQAQGIQAQGIQAQGIQAQGVSVFGSDVSTGDYKGVEIARVELRGATPASDVVDHELTSIPGVSTGTGNYITVDGLSVVGRYAVARLVDRLGAPAEDLDLYIAGEQVDPLPNLFHRADQQDNQDELYVVYAFSKFSGQWVSLCPYNPLTESASAMAIPEDPGHPNRFIFACTATGVASKCARNWGYRPWATTTSWVWHDDVAAWVEETFPLKGYYDACVVAARAAYCQDGKSYTKNGTLVDLFDTRQIIWPNAIENPLNALNPDSQWMMAQEYFISFAKSPTAPLTSTLRDSALQRTRYRELSPIGECDDLAYVDRLEHDHFEDGRWANPLTNVERLEIFSPTYCDHDEYTAGDGLPWDCSPCTTQVCKTQPSCCVSGPASWDPSCVTTAAAACKDSNGQQFPVGKVWPRDVDTSGPTILPKFLLGAAGAVERVDGVSTSAVTVSGWACDPEWPDAATAVRIYVGAPRGEVGSTQLLPDVRADQALATPLAREVSAACDGPGRDTAHHGFSYTLPAGVTGNVFVYAVDEATADGPASPPALLRNGIVHVPTCAHSEHVVGAALDAGCSACAGSICGDGTHGDCCATTWTDACAAEADACPPAGSSAPANSRTFAAVTTGWLEAPATGSFLFDSSLQPSRLSINGTTVLDWFAGAGTQQGSLTLTAGMKYAFRWDRFQSAPPASDAGPGLTWQPPGASGQTPIPAGLLYRIAPGAGTGLAATYYAGPAFTGATVTRTDAFVDINNDVAPPSQPGMALPAGIVAPYSAKWVGEIVPTFSEEYTFTVVGSGAATLKVNGVAVAMPTPASSSVGAGCPHDLCTLGDKLAASSLGTPACDPCVDKICAKDPYCCDGGYLSYYSTEPVWDARCIAEVKAFCAPAECTTPIPTPGSPHHKSTAVPLVAGVRYGIELAYDNATSDKTVRLLWASARTAKQVVSQASLFPAGTPPAAAGAGLNVTLFGTTLQNGVRKPNLATAVAAGATPDLSVTGPVGGEGTPEVELLSGAGGTPPPPAVTRPRYGDQILGATPAIAVHGIGGLAGGSVRITVVEDATLEAIANVAADGSFDAVITPASFGTWTLRLVQRSNSDTPCVAPACAESQELTWPVTVALTPPSGPAPVITSPRDPTHSPDPTANVFGVVGKATPAAVVDIQELGGSTASVSPLALLPDDKGNLGGKLTLSAGDDADPNKGWHKLVFRQNGVDSKPVFVSVGIRPPTVVFPRSGAEINCDEAAPDPRQLQAVALLPYTVEQFGKPRVFEETGRSGLRAVPNEGRVFTQQVNGQLLTGFITTLFLDYGKHLIYFFQAPDPPANARPDEIDAHFRAYAALANTPYSRIQIDTPPPRFLTQTGAVLVRGTKAGSTLPLTVGDCVPGQSPPNSGCALPHADVNVRVGPRLYTTRADATGSWSIVVPLTQGWNDVTLAQVIDSTAGGGWRESCPSNPVAVGVETTGSITFTTPGPLTAVATGPDGARVTYAVSAQSSDGNPVAVDCLPASGAIFPLGATLVHCTGVDQETGAIGLGGFLVTVLDGPPVIHVPPNGLTVEATGPLGALVNFEVTADDAVSGPVPVACAPSSPVQVMVDLDTTVLCEASDGKTSPVTATFPIRVRDTTPPVMCPLRDIVAGTNAGAGAIVTFSPCADDLVDGSVPVTCDWPSGSLFPVGKTVVTCGAVDKHKNQAAPVKFTVSVGDTTPPVLKLPGPITAYATSRNGAKVSYTVTVTDNVDKKPALSCAPASGSQFPLGPTTVNCKAKDAAGNVAQGSFLVKVLVSFGGFTAPANGAKVKVKTPLPVKFKLSGVSAPICDLPARLLIAPVDAAGKVGPEKPAPGMPPCANNLFDYTSGQYQFTLDTRGLAAGLWQLRADLGDGEPHTLSVTLTK